MSQDQTLEGGVSPITGTLGREYGRDDDGTYLQNWNPLLLASELPPGKIVGKDFLGTRVIVYRAGTQSQVAVSPPAPEHRIKLDPGDYDVYVENNSGKGRPYATAGGIHLEPGAKVEREVSLDDGKN